MRITLSAPSKTFLIGEYLALAGGPCLLVNTAPRFVCEVETDGLGVCHGIHPNSPAGRWMREHKDQFSRFDVDFKDLHEGRGGFGASSSQFLFVYAIAEWWNNKLLKEGEWDLSSLLRHYRQLSATNQGITPSGGDLLAQLAGGICLVKPSQVTVEPMSWHFHGKDFFIIRTGQKINTHEHLMQIKLDRTEALESLVQTALMAHQAREWPAFCESINAYYNELVQRGWVALWSQKMVSELRNWPEVEAVKSCGALGADTIILFFSSENQSALTEKLTACGWPVVASQKDLSPGLNFEMQFLSPSYQGPSLSLVERGLDV